MNAEPKNDKRGELVLSFMPLFANEQGQGKVRLILASQSPRRREILDMMGLQGLYETIPSPLDESALQAELLSEIQAGRITPKDYTRRLAEQKALALVQQKLHHPDSKDDRSTLVLGSDTIVEIHNRILEKPTSADQARSMLRTLAGHQHHVHTGVAIVRAETAEVLSSFTETANVTFAALTEQDIEAYVATGEPMDKAGSYGIQGIGGQLVQSVDGDFFCVMGLPMHRVSRALAQAIEETCVSRNT